MTHFLSEARQTTSIRSRALTGVALSAVSMALLASGQAAAQQAAEPQEITITGSRIKAPNLTSDSPVLGVTKEEIAQSNTPAVEGLLNQLPSVMVNLTAASSSQTYDTTSHIDLRGLGVTRTLVLIDGKRIGPSDPQGATGAAADLNFIPTALIQSVEVMTGGASAAYGSDAVAGVVNFKLIRNFQGAELDYSFTADQHSNNNSEFKQVLANTQIVSTGFKVAPAPKNNFDGFIRDSSGIVGANSADGKGNVTIYADYRATTPVGNNSRDWNSCAISATYTNNQSYKFCAGSSNTQYGKFVNLPGLVGISNKVGLNPDGSATFVKFTNSLLFNFAAYQYLQRQDDRAALGSYGHYEVNPHADLYAEMMYMDDSSQQEIGPAALPFGGVGGVQTTLTIPCNNPYLGHSPGPLGVSQYTAIGCAPGIASATLSTFPGLRLLNPRTDVITHDDYRALAGVRGDIDGNFSYDVSLSHWQTQFTRKDINFPLLSSVDSAITNGTLNIFQYQGDASQVSGLTNVTGLIVGQTKEDDAQFTINGDLGPYGGKSPFASSPVALAFGAEYRHDISVQTSDGNEAAGQLLFDTQQPSFNGGERVFEEFGELNLPIIQDKPFVRSASLDLALRHSDYHVDNTNSAFSTNTYKVSGDYSPLDDFRLRGGFSRAARAPNVGDLFTPATFGTDGGYSDPCSPTGNNLVPNAAYRAACTNPAIGKAAVTAAQFANGLVPQCPANECNNITGGNVNLKPEEADTWTWGVVVTPTAIPGLTGSLDYWDAKVSGYVGPIQGATIINDCYSGITSYCQYISRDPLNGGLIGNGATNETNHNLDQLHYRGIDVELAYLRQLEDLGLGANLGSLSVHLSGTYMLDVITQNQATVLSYNCVGEYGPNCNATSGGPQPAWRHQMRLTWTTPWDADISLNWRYINSVRLDSTDPKQPDYGNSVACCSVPVGALDGSIPTYNYIDLSASYRLWEKYTFRLGVNNLMDKDPPVLNQSFALNGALAGQNGNTYNTYDTLGRVLFMSFQAKW